ncbi:universal stress protein [Sandaracinus amylolyticus]|uniref:UspA domain-containing protein n=1 Tax=Sandaracinus amylolyticus TaxID=927083 RepID=A0A0F6W032_9BACT|nr:universal stress protein [Sandaracinus amylolyticus]AKF04043.1 hypothetical protein DB32_001192 [Sandaracinus amylolyticus]
MTSQSSLVVGIDFRAASARALGHALAMLRKGCASQVHVVHVLPPELARDEALLHAVPEAIADVVAQMGARAPSRPTWAHVRAGRVRPELRRLAFDLGADTIVLGARPQPRVARGVSAQVVDDPYAPFSVLVAGDHLELDARGLVARRCVACEAIRRTPDVTWPWCVDHRPLGAGLPRRLDAPDASDGLGRVVH